MGAAHMQYRTRRGQQHRPGAQTVASCLFAAICMYVWTRVWMLSEAREKLQADAFGATLPVGTRGT
jgi:hypothetical protein